MSQQLCCRVRRWLMCSLRALQHHMLIANHQVEIGETSHMNPLLHVPRAVVQSYAFPTTSPEAPISTFTTAISSTATPLPQSMRYLINLRNANTFAGHTHTASPGALTLLLSELFRRVLYQEVCKTLWLYCTGKISTDSFIPERFTL